MIKIGVLIVVVFFGLLLTVDSAQKEVTIAIIGTNDIHGTALPTLLERVDSGQKYKYGGLAYMGRLIQIIKNQYPNRSIYLDAGDQFQGGIESSSLISSGTIMNDFFSAMQLQGAAIGNHQFDFGPDFLFPYYQTRRVPNLAANLVSETNIKNFMPRQQSSKIFVLDQDIKIGVLGLATLETPKSTAGFQRNLFPPYKFLKYREVVLEQAKKLRKNGADAVIIVAHVGNDCPQKIEYGFWNKSTLQAQCPPDEVTDLIDSLPPGTIDAIVQGHRHRIVHHFYKDIPFMGSINGGYYFNVMHLRFMVGGNLKKEKKLMDITIQGPIPVCEKVFQKTGRCNYMKEHELPNAGKLVPWSFHKKEVYAHPAIKAIYDTEWEPKMKPYYEQVALNQILLERDTDKQNQLGNLLSNLLHAAVPQANLVIINPGGFRSTWIPGVIQYQHLYNMQPFTNQIVTFKITGKELGQMLKVLQQGTAGFYQTWNLQQTVKVIRDKSGLILEKKYIDGKFIDGTDFEDETMYTGVSIDFLMAGGDDFKTVIDKKIYQPRDMVFMGDLRQTYKQQLKKLGTIKQNTLIDPDHPRLIVRQTI